ncbi:MAG TPA: DUF4878 domain-containing protein [Salinivirga sp.]|uniref:DUF4878 domain-containing protein n=1 Tax=Salinivirga sp. TaxID=1970192 RepID=UPI002B4989F0|nr:DUF4878 domain-containing protein [Salinivirga sp.]HKK59076.1 DUF4878 domain-containing protein [Salinivirga sp.]
MKKLAFLLTILAAAATMFFACGGEETPGDITEKVYFSLADGEYDYVIDKLDTNGDEMTDEDREKLKKILEMSKGQIEKKGGIKTVSIVKEEISEDGKTCNVQAEVEYGNGDKEPANSNLVMVDGAWMLTVGK